MEAKIRRGRMLREIFRQERLAPQPIEFQLAWMTAYNDGMFDGLAPGALPGCLKRIGAHIEQGGLALDADRKQWQEALAGWLKEGIAT